MESRLVLGKGSFPYHTAKQGELAQLTSQKCFISYSSAAETFGLLVLLGESVAVKSFAKLHEPS